MPIEIEEFRSDKNILLALYTHGHGIEQMVCLENAVHEYWMFFDKLRFQTEVPKLHLLWITGAEDDLRFIGEQAKAARPVWCWFA